MGNELVAHKEARDTGSHVVLGNAELSRPLSVQERQAQINIIQELMRNNMKEGTHYGKVFTTAKPSLWKPGAEMIAMTLRIALDHVIEDLSTGDDVRYRVKAVATRQVDGLFLGATYGECWSAEQKYMWREAVVTKEFEATPEDRRRVKFEKANNRDGYTETYQVRTHPPDTANTILKMACKRSDIAVILLVTAASDIFTQDIEDLPAEMLDAITDADKAQAVDVDVKPEPKRASETTAAAPPVKEAGPGLFVVGVRKGKETPEWTLYKIKTSDGVERASFSKSAYENADKAMQQKKPISFDGKETAKGFEITAVEILS
jgi:hypothetical protein